MVVQACNNPQLGGWRWRVTKSAHVGCTDKPCQRETMKGQEEEEEEERGGGRGAEKGEEKS